MVQLKFSGQVKMFGIELVLMVILLSLDFSSSEDLRKKCLRPRGQFPSDNCHTFINCWDGNVSEQRCPGNLRFNPYTAQCDYPSKVDCRGRRVDEDLTDLRKKCLTPKGQFPTDNCHTFINCWDDDVEEQRCPDDLLFNAVTAQCDYPSNVVCAGRSHDDDNSTDLRKKCLRTRGQFPSKNCHTFINCWDGDAQEQRCPNDLVFNAKTSQCDYRSNVDCTGRTLDGEIIQAGDVPNLFCYDCDPSSEADKCDEPDVKGARVSKCEPRNTAEPNIKFACISAYFNASESATGKSGIRRLCADITTVADGCDYIKEEINSKGYTMTSCASCTEEKCNTHRFKDDGTINGASIMSYSVLALVINALLCLGVFRS